MTMPIANALCGIAVSDIAASASWYAGLLGRDATARPMDGLQEWQFPGGGWIQLYEKAEHAGHCAVTLVVADIAACRDWLAKAGQDDVQSSDSAATSITILKDPDGNQVVFAQSNDIALNPSVSVAK